MARPIWLVAWALWWARLADAMPSLIGEAYFPYGHRHEDRSFSQISGCSTRRDGKVALVGDDRREPNVFLADVSYAAGGVVVALARGSAQLAGLPDSIDAEGVSESLDLGGDVLVAGEDGAGGANHPGVWRDEPSLSRFSPDGHLLERYDLPIHFAHDSTDPAKTGRGTRSNGGFEGLATTPAAGGGGRIYVANEIPLFQDAGSAVSATRRLPVRIAELHLGARAGELALKREYRYDLSPSPPSQVPDAQPHLGVAALAALGDSRLLVLERAWDNRRNRVEVYVADLSGATPVEDCDSLADGPCEGRAPVPKTLLFDLEKDYGVAPNNYEGMCWAPSTADGTRVLLLVSDDNGNPHQNGTHFVALAWPDDGALRPRHESL